MEWKTIRNAGHICIQAKFPKGKKFAVAAEFLEGVVKEFARASSQYCDLIDELPFIYKERQIHSVLHPAVAKSADVALVEMPVSRQAIDKPDSSHGWVDYWACCGEVDFLIEVKHSWQAIDSASYEDRYELYPCVIFMALVSEFG